MPTGIKATMGESVKPVDNTGDKVVSIPQTESSAPETRPIVAKALNLEDLTFLGRITDKFPIGGFEFEMATLTAGENETALLNTGVSSPEDIRAMGSLPYYVLAYSVKSINGITLGNIAANHDGDTTYEKKVAYLKTLQQTVISALMEHYSKLQTRSSTLIDGEQSKN